jgi:transposase
MEIVYKCCCGLDIHKNVIVGCCVNERGEKQTRSFGTMTDDLLEFCGWLKERKAEMVAMESTASYWKPVFNLLEAEGIPAILVNAQHVKNVPGRKTDVKDSEWIADLLRHGLLRPSRVPPREDRELKELVRYRTSMIEERAREYNRLDKVLQGANIKLSSVASSMDTKSGMAMIGAIVEGECNAEVLATMAKGTLKQKEEDLKRALKGFIQPHQQIILKSMLSHIGSLGEQIERLDEEIDRRLRGSKGHIVEMTDEIPGVGKQTAQIIVAEVGIDMSEFPSEKHLSSWAGVCPGNNESAGKKKEARHAKATKR